MFHPKLKNLQIQKKEVEKYASLWNSSPLPLQWTNTKIWSEAVASNSNTNSGGFWEEPAKSSNIQKSNNASGTIEVSKLAVRGHSGANVQVQTASPKQNIISSVPEGSPLKTKGATNATHPSKKAKHNNSSKKASAATDNNCNNEFTAWCSKALAAHVNVIDGEYRFLTNQKKDLFLIDTFNNFSADFCVFFA